MQKVRTAIIGMGSMGRRWAKVANSCAESCLRLIVDTDRNKAKEAEEFLECDFTQNLNALLSPAIDAVIVAAPNAFLAPITKFALQNGKHVLCEKPAGINSKEIKENTDIGLKSNLVYMVGFNHRFHPAVARAKQLVSAGSIGDIYFIRSVYGHGGRIGYENEWRNKMELSGGGELLDQGIHLIDLAFWFLGDNFAKIHGILGKNFWSKTLEDNAFITMQNRYGATALLHASWTQWQKKFIWEIYGKSGYIAVEGLGGNYGTETLKIAVKNNKRKMRKEKITIFPPRCDCIDPDLSLFSLWREFTGAIKSNTVKSPSGNDALNALRVIEKIYQQGGRK